MANKNRDEFREKTKLQAAKRAGFLCSDPLCRRATYGATSDGNSVINLGKACHICAAAPNGPRYDTTMTREERRAASNCIWMCEIHGSAIDTHDTRYTVDLLKEWKAQAEKESFQRVMYDNVPHDPVAISEDELRARLRTATATDLDVFRRSDKWPPTAIELTLEVEGVSNPVSTSAVATALTTLDDLIVVAPPGTGKTTTLFQIAEAALANGNAFPIVVPLGNWSTGAASLLESVLKRPTFQGISEGDLRTVAAKPGVMLLLDGWNELDSAARKRAAFQVENLQNELPQLSLLISTRKQALDVPVDGTCINLLPLSETQQMELARALRGDQGVRILDQAWRTAGVRELVTIPLYLTVLLTLPESASFPTTKDAVVQLFVAAHEKVHLHAEALAEVTHGLHQRFLECLAVTASRAANTTITDDVARRSITETEDVLVAEGQITDRPQPNIVLEVLVSHHVLTRAGDPAGYSFHHQQFQEWYASHFVERIMLESVDDNEFIEKLKADILNQPAWEEAILFACERLARGNQRQQKACGTAIIAAFAVDPALAAEMIFRSTDAVWASVGPTILGLVARWHTPGKVDRALRFMISSGRPEFLDTVWPFITDENNQIHLAALRVGRRFSPSLFGKDAAGRLALLLPKIRQNVLEEIVFNSGMEGLDLAAAVAMADPDPDVKATVVNALAFRSADRHVADVLRRADDKTFDLVVGRGLIDEVTDEVVKSRLEAALDRLRKDGVSTYDKMQAIVYAHDNRDLSEELVTLIAEMEIDRKQDRADNLIYMAQKRFPGAVAEGILRRVREGRALPYSAKALMVGSGFAFEDDSLLDIALGAGRYDDRANTAASVLGPQAVGRMIDRMFEDKKLVRDASGKRDNVANDRYHSLRDLMGHTQTTSLLAAIAVRSAHVDNQDMVDLADLISRHLHGDDERGEPLNAAALATISGFVEDWGKRLLVSPDTTRAQLASIATLARQAPSVRLLPLLKRLLDEDLRRWRAFKEQARADQYRGGTATDEARMSWTLQYQRAFHAIGGPEMAALMREYLPDEYFGEDAARVLALQWTIANESSEEKHRWGGVDFSRVEERRAVRGADPTATSAEAEAIFSAIEPLISNGATEDMKKLAASLGIVAVRLPHGERDATIQKLLSFVPRRPRAALLQNLVLSGESIDIELVKKGLEEMFEAAIKQRWILTEGYELKEWLRLLPFTNRPTEALNVVLALPDNQRTPERLEEMIAAYGVAPGDDAENMLFKLAEVDARLYEHPAWLDAVMRRGTLSAARQFVDLAANGIFNGKVDMRRWDLASQLGGLISEYPELRTHVYNMLQKGPTPQGLALLAQAVAENPDAVGLILLVKIEIEHKGSFMSWRTIEKVVTEQVAAENMKGAYNVLPVPATELRQKLLALTTNGGPTDAAARCLNQIDKIRDDYGTPESESRHPDLASGKPWPILPPASIASEVG